MWWFLKKNENQPTSKFIYTLLDIYPKDVGLYHKDTYLLSYAHWFSIYNRQKLEAT